MLLASDVAFAIAENDALRVHLHVAKANVETTLLSRSLSLSMNMQSVIG